MAPDAGEEGRAESRREVAGKMKADGLETSLIAKYSGLTVEEVEAL